MNLSKITLLIAITALTAACSTQLNKEKSLTLTATESYQCDSEIITAKYYDIQNSNLVSLERENTKGIFAANVVSADGARYVGGITEWWVKGDSATLRDLTKPKSKAITCRAIKS